MNYANKAVISSFFFLLLLSGCIPHSKMRIRRVVVTMPSRSATLEEIHATPVITIWIHGTRFIPQHVFSHEFDERAGLKRSIEINPYYYLNQIAHILHYQDPAMYPLETFYAFSWSGHLSHYQRLKASEALYEDLVKVIVEYQERYKVYPEINIITHSHGGNVALNLAFVEQIKQAQLRIKRLVLMACPVQLNTMRYVSSSVFDRVYSLSSSLDFVQVIAPQKFNEALPFSDRYFPRERNLLQASIKLNKRALFHTEFSARLFLSSLPTVIHFLDTIDINAYNKSSKYLYLHITNLYKKRPKSLFLQSFIQET